MSQMIAGMYEIQNKIGAGGGGIVYMGRHLRLDKPVVLKADKRTLSAGMDTLRREVDLLKGLSHTYIPQVYDFVQEDGVVYTVMDFIEGESCDKLIGRGKLPAQPEVIKWARQLLEALVYLHSQPPHGILHGDIKPANIMVRPGGDICLIDYNIALMLGEDGAVKVGYSRGYASPEHYGADYIRGNRPAAVGQISNLKDTEDKDADETATLTETLADNSEFSTETLADNNESPTETLVDNGGSLTETLMTQDQKASREVKRESESVKSVTSGRKGILLDVRSDIYSLGATLYYLLSGKRPAEKAEEVVPLGTDVCSPAVSEIIQKAMAQDPAMRYQSAEEMLAAFLQLDKKDKRVIRLKKQMKSTAVVLTVLFLGGGICSFVGLKQLEQMQRALTLSEYSANALAQGDTTSAVELAMQAIPRGGNMLEAPVTAQAQKALTDALGVYDLSDGFKALDRIQLPAEPFDMMLSPNGTYLAAVYAYEAAVYETDSGRKMAAFPVQESALSDVVFTDETHIVYAGSQGVTAYDLAAGKNLWTKEKATTLTVSADGRVAASVNRDDDYAVIYRVSDGEKLAQVSFDGLHMSTTANDIFADPGNDMFALNEDGSMLGVSFYNGGVYIFDLAHAEESLVVYEESGLRHFSGGFCGNYFAYAAWRDGEAVFGLVDVETGTHLGEHTSSDRFYLRTDERGIYLANGRLLVSLDPDTMEEQELAYADEANITDFSIGEQYVLAATENDSAAFYDGGAHLALTLDSNDKCDFVSLAGKYAVIGSRNSASVRIMKLEKHDEAQLLAYDPHEEHDEARLSQDGRTVMLFSCRNFCIFDMAGNCLVKEMLPEPENIYDQQFIRSDQGSWLETIWYDGTVRCYSAEDGSLLSEEKKEAPAKDLYEEFYIDKYRIASSLHEAPKVYDLATGELVAVLEENSYLTYVTQTEGYIMTEYISASGNRYGILLNQEFEKLAYLPGLCDIVGDRLIFDYESGDLRQCTLYSLEELVSRGEKYAVSSVQEPSS